VHQRTPFSRRLQGREGSVHDVFHEHYITASSCDDPSTLSSSANGPSIAAARLPSVYGIAGDSKCIVQGFDDNRGCGNVANELLVDPGSKTVRAISDSLQGRAGPQNRGEGAQKGLKRAKPWKLELRATHALGLSVSNLSTGNRQVSALTERMSIVDDGDGQQGFRLSWLMLIFISASDQSEKRQDDFDLGSGGGQRFRYNLFHSVQDSFRLNSNDFFSSRSKARGSSLSSSQPSFFSSLFLPRQVCTLILLHPFISSPQFLVPVVPL
jgi:hypothetical protein